MESTLLGVAVDSSVAIRASDQSSGSATDSGHPEISRRDRAFPFTRDSCRARARDISSEDPGSKPAPTRVHRRVDQSGTSSSHHSSDSLSGWPNRRPRTGERERPTIQRSAYRVFCVGARLWGADGKSQAFRKDPRASSSKAVGLGLIHPTRLAAWRMGIRRFLGLYGPRGPSQVPAGDLHD